MHLIVLFSAFVLTDDPGVGTTTRLGNWPTWDDSVFCVETLVKAPCTFPENAYMPGRCLDCEILAS